MLSDTTCVPTIIAAGKSIRIDDGEGVEISSIDGQLWITQEGDQRDIILHPGQSFTLDRNGLALLVALEEPAAARIIGRGERRTYKALVNAGIVTGPACAEPHPRREVEIRGRLAA